MKFEEKTQPIREVRGSSRPKKATPEQLMDAFDVDNPRNLSDSPQPQRQ